MQDGMSGIKSSFFFNFFGFVFFGDSARQKSEAGSDRGSAMKAELATLELIEKHR